MKTPMLVLPSSSKSGPREFFLIAFKKKKCNQKNESAYVGVGCPQIRRIRLRVILNPNP